MWQKLPGIKKIGLLSRTEIPDNVVKKAEAGIVVTVSQEPDYIDFVGEPTFEVDDKFDNNSRYQTAKLKFCLSNPIYVTYNYVIFVQTVNGECYVMGEKEDSSLLWNSNSTSGTPSGDPNKWDYEVVFFAKKALIPCVLET